MKLRVNIERLVLEFPLSAAEGRRVKAGLEQELARLLSDRGLRPELRAATALPAAPAGAFEPSSDASARQLGQEIARSVHAGIGLSK
jgi:hypothetical protein